MLTPMDRWLKLSLLVTILVGTPAGAWPPHSVPIDEGKHKDDAVYQMRVARMAQSRTVELCERLDRSTSASADAAVLDAYWKRFFSDLDALRAVWGAQYGTSIDQTQTKSRQAQQQLSAEYFRKVCAQARDPSDGNIVQMINAPYKIVYMHLAATDVTHVGVIHQFFDTSSPLLRFSLYAEFRHTTRC
jgi:hypothetical protein